MRTLKFRVIRRSLERMYSFYVRPLIEYSDSVWDNCSTESKNKLESIHSEAAKVITGATKLCSIKKLSADLGWEPLQRRRNKHKLVIFYKILHGIAPTYLLDIVPPLYKTQLHITFGMLEIFRITECTPTYSPIPSSPPQYAPGTTYQTT